MKLHNICKINKMRAKNKFSSQKIILDTQEDLYNLPVEVIKNTKIYNYSGKYYDELYKRALDIEAGKEVKKPIRKKSEPKNNQEQKKPEVKKKEIKNPEPKKEEVKKPEIKKTQNNNNIVPKSEVKKPKKKKSSTNSNNTSNPNKININAQITNKPEKKKAEIKIDKIIYQMQYQTFMGQELGVIGSISQIGNWDQGNATKLRWTDGNIWIVDIYLNGITEFEYKFIFIENNWVKTWEDGNNRFYNFNEIKGRLDNGNVNGDFIYVYDFNQTNLEYDIKNNALKIICQWNRK